MKVIEYLPSPPPPLSPQKGACSWRGVGQGQTTTTEAANYPIFLR